MPPIVAGSPGDVIQLTTIDLLALPNRFRIQTPALAIAPDTLREGRLVREHDYENSFRLQAAEAVWQ